jgi:ATP-dependent DNA helicase DinG
MSAELVVNFAEAESILAARLSGYSPRTTQQRAARAVEGALALGEHLLLQAGTGTGKSFALLIPAIIDALVNRRRVMLGTATKALQAQYMEKDLPFLAQHLGLKFRYALLQGRSNYLCQNRAALVYDEDPLVADILEVASQPGFSGLGVDLSFDVPQGLWSKVNGNSEECDELGCKNIGGCWALKAREEAADAQVVVVNHALLATDCAIEGNPLLGHYQVAIVDEVHELPEWAIKAFETRFSELSVRNLQVQVRSLVTRAYGGDDRVEGASQDLTGANGLFWMALTAQMPEKEEKLRITEAVILKAESEWVSLSNSLTKFALTVEALPLPISSEDAKRFRLLKKEALNLARKFEALIRDEFTATVRWVEWAENRRGQRGLVVRAQPIEIGPFLQDRLYQDRVVVGASATVAPGGKFDFVAGRLGLDIEPGSYRGLDVGTNFDYQRQALTYIPNIASPADPTRAEWEAALPNQVMALLQASRGRAFVLFTSNRQLDRVYHLVAPHLPWAVYKQGQMPTQRLMEAFKADTHSVLFATKSFFTGVDVQGEALSMVILDKLPFPPQHDPVVEATLEAYDRRYGDRGGWARYYLPSTQMVLEQAYGRLIRTSTDRGVFACLDSRLLKGWGKGMARKLPPAPQTTSFADVQRFFSEESEGPDGDDIAPF